MEDDLINGNMSSYPYFELNVPRNVTTAVGQTAFLHCRVEQLGDKAVRLTVSYFALHILTDYYLRVNSSNRSSHKKKRPEQ